MQRFVLVVCALTVCYMRFSSGRYLTDKTTDNTDTAEETQHAVCKIVTEELQATANVTLTRELKGVCTSNEMKHKLEEMQQVLLGELISIRKELKEKLRSPEIMKPSYRHLSEYEGDPIEIKVPPQKFSSLQKRTVQDQNTLDEYSVVDTSKLNDERRTQILKYNATINSSVKGTYFYYFWKVENINEILSDRRGISVRSPSFTLLGHNFHILMFPHHLTSKYLGIQLKAPQGYFLKHRFTIIDHVSPRGDLSSQLLGDERNYAVMYRVAHDRIENQNFIDGDELIIRLTITLR